MDHLEIWKHMSKIQATWLGVIFGFIIASILHWNDCRISKKSSRNKKKKLIK